MQEKISSGSNWDVLHNLQGKSNILQGTIGSQGNSSAEELFTFGNGLVKRDERDDRDSQHSNNFSNMSGADGGPIDLEKILTGEETRTCLMVKNIPCRYTHNEIKSDFEMNHKNHFNDLKLPSDKNNNPEKTNRSYCFINFRHVLYVYNFVYDKKNYHWPKYSSDKVIDIHYAKE